MKNNLEKIKNEKIKSEKIKSEKINSGKNKTFSIEKIKDKEEK